MKTILYGDEAREKLIEGVNAVANAVGVTFGPATRSVIIDRRDGLPPLVVNDGVTVAKNIILEDKMANAGAKLVIEVASRAQENAGDGTTSSTIMAQSLIQRGEKLLNTHTGVAIRTELERLCKLTCDELDALSLEVEGRGIYNVAKISANNDEQMAELIHQAVEKIGYDGVISVEPSPTGEDTVSFIEGFECDKGYINPVLSKLFGESKTFDKPLILVSNADINDFAQLIPALEYAKSKNRPLIVVCTSIGAVALNTYVMNQVNGNIDACIVQAEDISFWQTEKLNDLAIFTGGKMINKELDMAVADTNTAFYGQCNKAIISSKKAAFLGFMGSDNLLLERLEEIETEESMAENDFYKKKHSVRYGKLQGNAAVIGISGLSEQEIQNKLERVDDALNATRAAIAEGVIRGAGVELYSIGLMFSHEDTNEIEDVFYKTLKTPLQKIYYNINGKELFTEQDSVIADGFLYDGNNNMFTSEAPVFDPVRVVKSSLRSAVSVAGYVLTADCLIGE
tara:strand:- start:7 stop:1542 length:1536 start_codon:yes stop_codon:yes gene_type:complete